MLNRKPFLNLYIDQTPSALFVDPDAYLSNLFTGRAIQVISLNLEQVVLAQDDPEYRKIISEAELIIPDGVSIVWTYRLLNFFSPDAANFPLKKLAGIDLAAKLIESKQKIAIWGAKKEIIELLKKKLKDKLVFAEHGYFNLDQKDEILERLIKSKPDLLLVGMGAPKQEMLIYECKSKLDTCVCMGVGGALDVWSGKLQRAASWMIFLNLEWFFRIIQEPSRLKRFLYNVRRYVLLMIHHLNRKLTR